MSDDSAAPPPRRIGLACLLLFSIALGVRALPHARAFHAGKVFFFGSDSWHEMRRTEFAMRNGLALPEPDPYLGYPEGGRTHWGPLLAKGTALGAMLLGVDPRERPRLETFCAWVPAVLGAAGAVAAFGLGLLLLGFEGGVAAGLLTAVLPGHVSYTLLGNFDQHAAESFLFALASLLALAASRGGPGPSRSRLALAAAVVVWLLALLSPPLTALYAGMLWLALAAEGLGSGWFAWPVFALPAALLLPLAGRGLAAAAGVQRLSAVPGWLMFEQYSFFQPLLLAFFAASLKLLGEWRALRARTEDSAQASVRLGLLAAACGAMAVALAWPILAGASSTLFKGDPWVKLISEYRPLFFPGPDGAFQPRFAFQTCTYLLPLFPIILGWTAWRRRDAFLLVWPALLFCLAMLQLRYIYVFVYALALVLAAVWIELRKESPKFAAAAAVVLALSFVPCGRWLWSLAQGSPYRYLSLTDEQYSMLETLGRLSPPTAGFDDAVAKPEYGVLAPWSMGHALSYLARRAAVADPFGHGVEKEARFYTAVDETEAVSVLERNSIRYVVAQDMNGPAQAYAEYLGLAADHPLRQGRVDELFQTRLLAGKPAADGKKHPWSFTPVLSSDDGRPLLFEFSQGARPVAAKAAAPAAPKPAAPAGPKPAETVKTVAAVRAPAVEPPAAPSVRQPEAPAGIVARIGENRLITETDLADFTNSETCYGSDALNSRNAGFMRMLESSIMEEVLRREAHVELGAEDYARELKRVDEGTRAPEILSCIKKAFGWSPDSGWPDERSRVRYERVFLRKNILPPPFHKFVTFDHGVQKDAYGLSDAVGPKARQGEDFADLGRRYKIEYSSRTYSLTEPKEAGAAAPAAPPSPETRWSPFEAQFIEENLKGLSPGKVKPDALDAGDLTFVKLLEVRGDKYRFETLRIAKKSIPDYLGSLPKLTCSILDGELRAWIQSIHGNPMLAVCSVP